MKITKTTVVTLLILSTFSGLNLISYDVSATEPNNTWIANDAQSASNAASWENGTLITGQNIYFVDAHDGNCAWNVADSFGNYYIRTGYSGTITQAASFSVTSYSQAAGIYTGSTSYTLTDSGNFLKTGGTITDSTLNLIMSGASKTLTGIYNLYSLQVSGSLTMITADASGSRLIIDNGASFTMTGFNFHIAYSIGASTFSNAGTIIGGTLNYRLYYTERTISFGGVYTNVAFNFYATTTNANRILTAGTGLNAGGGSITVASQHATYTITLNLNGYPLSAAGITIGTRGIITAGTSTITDSGNWDSSASSNVASSLGSAKVHLTGASKTFKQSSVERISSLFFDVGSSYTLQSNVYCTNYWLNGTVTKNGYTVYVNNNQAPSITSSTVTSCHFINNYYYNVTATDQDDILTYGLTSSWPNVDINTTTGKITNVAPLANGTWLMSVSVTDGNHTIYQNFSLNIWNYAPIFITRAKYISPIYDNYFYSANATDSEGYSITFNCTFEGVWLVWNPTNHSLSGQTFEREIGYYDVSISAWDGYKTTWQNFTIKIEGPLTSMLVSFIIYFSFLLIVFGIILIGYFKIPLLLFFGIIMSIALAIPIITSFRDYAIFGIILILMNMTVSIMGLSRTKIGK